VNIVIALTAARMVVIPVTLVNHVFDFIATHSFKALSAYHFPIKKAIFNEANDLVAHIHMHLFFLLFVVDEAIITKILDFVN
jgi:hypothetical protein